MTYSLQLTTMGMLIATWIILVAAVLPMGVAGLTATRSCTRSTATKVMPHTTSTQLSARYQRPYYGEENEHDDMARQRSTDRPTQTRTDTVGPPVIPTKPKIVILGATGQIGRLVVRQLLDMKHLDATIVACVRDYDKACKVLYDDLQLPSNNNNNGSGPKLHIVQANLVPPEELPGYLDDPEEEAEWLETAQSAAAYYDNDVSDYDNRADHAAVDPNEALQEALKDCTTIISCVGSVRPTNIWTDWLARPFVRLLKPDVSAWCNDARHPYYVHFASTRKVLGIAEREQLRRQAAMEVMLEQEEEERDTKVIVPKIRLVRISDLCVAQAPWNLVPLLTNILRSMIFRYQDMAERLLEASTLIDTVILRPGDLVDEERDGDKIALQVCPTGSLPNPSIVGRDDVAALAVASALFKSPNEVLAEQHASWTSAAVDGPDPLVGNHDDSTSQTLNHPPFHCTLAVRWVGQDMLPYPPQGSKRDGYPSARVGLEHALNKIKKEQKKQRQLELRQQRQALFGGGSSAGMSSYPETVLRLAADFQQRRLRALKPYGLVVAIPVYFTLALIARGLCRHLFHYLSGQVWAQPCLGRINDFMGLVTAYMMAHLQVLKGHMPRWITSPHLLFRRFFVNKNYIHF